MGEEKGPFPLLFRGIGGGTSSVGWKDEREGERGREEGRGRGVGGRESGRGSGREGEWKGGRRESGREGGWEKECNIFSVVYIINHLLILQDSKL